MAASFSLPFRQIHLDFHTGAAVPDVGRDFNARVFAQTMKRAHVNSVTVFAKCHHGHLYYNTKRAERHPGLKKGVDMLGQQIDALHREGIRAPIYISVQCDEYAANTHPEWITRRADGALNTPKPLLSPMHFSGWQILDMNSDYQEYLAEQTAEVLKTFHPVDGIFFDMCWDQPSVSHAAITAMKKAGVDPENEQERNAHAHRVAIAYMKRFHKMVVSKSPRASVYFNSRPLYNLAEEVPYLAQVEIEALPTGGWGYMYFPKNVRFARTFGKQYMGMTARFHKSWADFGGLKPYPALEYETSQMMAHGARCSIGDQLHPRGTLDKGAYELIGKAYARVAEREEWLDAKPLSQIGLFQVAASQPFTSNQGADEGAVRMLTQLKHQFDVVMPSSNWSKYDLLILPDSFNVDAAFAKKLSAYLKKGGALIASGRSGLSPDLKSSVLPELGVTPIGESPFQTTFIRFERDFADGVPDSDHVLYDRSIRVKPAANATTVARIVEPYFERTWEHFSSHCQTPPAKLSPYPAAVLRGRAAYVSFPVFSAFANHGNYPYRLLVKKLIDRLLPEPLLTVDGPTGLEATVMQQPRRTIVHLLYYSAERRTPHLDLIEDIVPLYNIDIALKLPKPPKLAYLAPGLERVHFRYHNGRVEVNVPEVRGHQMIVFE